MRDKIKLLGTAAAEGIPALFCKCDVCMNIAKLGGRYIRYRSGTLVGEDMMIEYSPDLLVHKNRFGLRLDRVKHILISHNHSDHLCEKLLHLMQQPVMCRRDDATINIYGNESVEAAYNNSGIADSGQFEFVRLEVGRAVQVGSRTVLPLKATHDRAQNCLLFIIESGGKRFLYGHDSGFYLEETWALIERHKIDLAVLDCVFSVRESTYDGHMGFSDCLRVKERMLSKGVADGGTKFVLTHFSHNNFDNDKLEKMAQEYGFIIAYDGMEFAL